MGQSEFDPATKRRPWNAGRKLGAKHPLKPQQVWAARFRLHQDRRLRDRAMFDLAIDSKLRGCDLVKIKVGDLVAGGRVRSRAMVVQQKTGRPVQFELLDSARSSILAWLERRGGTLDDFVFPSRGDYARCISAPWVAELCRSVWGETRLAIAAERTVARPSLGCHRVDGVLAGKQSRLRSRRFRPLAKPFQHLPR